MALRFSMLASQLLADREVVLRSVSWPVLVWESPVQPRDSQVSPFPVTPARASSRQGPLEWHVLELRKRLPQQEELKLGRSLDSDVVLEEATVSRTHAFFRREPHTGMWHVVDAGSHNGTFVGGVLIVPGRPMPLFDCSLLRFGGVEMSFLQASAFEQYVRTRLSPPPLRLTHVG
ncbi:FHA domain-containing protein [Stigmatella sp. ncwal1]|uniref:FHA domain-containing protein n=1 Tax=Stigmatella ashevillensis TaxID=2995309 RepID=A0ABT5DAQ1_9BACT|nr:FHA domain-containing protein [Stigmatella ashevillena]MDC0710760.1 FHA domain-containing protein [Stigmatella ashevillena]